MKPRMSARCRSSRTSAWSASSPTAIWRSALLAEGKSADTAVGEIASKDVVTVDPQQSLEEAARLMAEHQIRRLPVTEEDGKLVGILAQADVAQSGHDALTGEVVQQISQ